MLPVAPRTRIEAEDMAGVGVGGDRDRQHEG